MVVRSPSVGNLEICRMPETPPVNFDQLAAFPTPREVTTPIPVTAITGRPSLSRVPAVIAFVPSIGPLDQRQPFAAPIGDPGNHHLGQVRRTGSRVGRSFRGI